MTTEYRIIEYARELCKKFGLTLKVAGATGKSADKVYFNPFRVVRVHRETGVDPYDVAYYTIYHEHMHNILDEKLSEIVREKRVKNWIEYRDRIISRALKTLGMPKDDIVIVIPIIGGLVEDYYINKFLYREVVDDPDRYERGHKASLKVIAKKYPNIIRSYLSLPFFRILDKVYLFTTIGYLVHVTLLLYEPKEAIELLKMYGLYDAYVNFKGLIEEIEKVEDIPEILEELAYSIRDWVVIYSPPR